MISCSWLLFFSIFWCSYSVWTFNALYILSCNHFHFAFWSSINCTTGCHFGSIFKLCELHLLLLLFKLWNLFSGRCRLKLICYWVEFIAWLNVWEVLICSWRLLLLVQALFSLVCIRRRVVSTSLTAFHRSILIRFMLWHNQVHYAFVLNVQD